MKKTNFIFILSIFCAVLFSGRAAAVLGQEGIVYPVAELGGCADQGACKAYCDNESNISACLEFAKKNNLMTAGEIKKAEVFVALGNKGPGGCSSKNECEQYCDNTGHTAECVDFAVKNNLLSGAELEEARKMQAALAQGITPPACGSKDKCDVYCDNPAHMEECVNFAIKAGFIQGQELEDAKKMLAAVKKGAVPPPCKGKAECDAYCQQEANFQKCLDFALAAGFMSEADAKMAKKTGGKGPGGCISKEACDVFCKNPANQETCFAFGRDNGLIPAEELQKMEEGKKQMQSSLAGAPAEVLSCLEQKLGAAVIAQIQSGTYMPTQAAGEAMRACFEANMPQGMPPAGQGGGMAPGAGFGGPGGCKTPEECQAYCQTHVDECKNFAPLAQTMGIGQTMPPMPADQQMPQTMPAGVTGPGGCKSPEECMTYCQANPAACQNFAPPSMPQIQIAPMQTPQSPMPMDAPAGGGQMVPGLMVPPAIPTNYDPGAAGQMPPMPDGSMPMPPGGQIPQNQMAPMMEPMPQAPPPMPMPEPPAPAPEAPLAPVSWFDPLGVLAALADAFLNLFRR